MGKRRVAEAGAGPVSGPLYHIIRYDYMGDPGKRVGSNVSKEVAEQYVSEHQACGPGAFDIVKA